MSGLRLCLLLVVAIRAVPVPERAAGSASGSGSMFDQFAPPPAVPSSNQRSPFFEPAYSSAPVAESPPVFASASGGFTSASGGAEPEVDRTSVLDEVASCPPQSVCVDQSRCSSADAISYERRNDIYHQSSQYDQEPLFTQRFTCGQTGSSQVCCPESSLITLAAQSPASASQSSNNPFGFPDSLGSGSFHFVPPPSGGPPSQTGVSSQFRPPSAPNSRPQSQGPGSEQAYDSSGGSVGTGSDSSVGDGFIGTSQSVEFPQSFPGIVSGDGVSSSSQQSPGLSSSTNPFLSYSPSSSGFQQGPGFPSSNFSPQQPSRYPLEQPSGFPPGQPSHFAPEDPRPFPPEDPRPFPPEDPRPFPPEDPRPFPLEDPRPFPPEQPRPFPPEQPSRFPPEDPSRFPPEDPSRFPPEDPRPFPPEQLSPFPIEQPSRLPPNYQSQFPSQQPSQFPSQQSSQFPSQQPNQFPSQQPSRFPQQPSFPVSYPLGSVDSPHRPVFPSGPSPSQGSGGFPSGTPGSQSSSSFPSSFVPSAQSQSFPASDYPFSTGTFVSEDEFPQTLPPTSSQRPIYFDGGSLGSSGQAATSDVPQHQFVVSSSSVPQPAQQAAGGPVRDSSPQPPAEGSTFSAAVPSSHLEPPRFPYRDQNSVSFASRPEQSFPEGAFSVPAQTDVRPSPGVEPTQQGPGFSEPALSEHPGNPLGGHPQPFPSKFHGLYNPYKQAYPHVPYKGPYRAPHKYKNFDHGAYGAKPHHGYGYNKRPAFPPPSGHPGPHLPPPLPPLQSPSVQCGLSGHLSDLYSSVFGEYASRISSGYGREPGVADYADHPWHAAVLRRAGGERGRRLGGFEYVCGATLVSEQHLITAAHCVQGDRPQDLLVRLGEYNLYSDQEELLPPLDGAVQAIHVHPDYLASVYRSDLAVLQLERPLLLDRLPHVTPACLDGPDLTDDYDIVCQVPGWGYDAYKTQPEQSPHALKSVAVRPVPAGRCTHDLRGTLLGGTFHLQKGSFCAGGDHGQDTCLGDGGGGLLCPVYDAPSEESPPRYVLVGVTSWGVRCGDGRPGVYTEVKKHLGWIKNVIDSPSISPFLTPRPYF